MDNPKKSWPCHAKVAVVYGGASAEAWMDLPTAETRSGIQSLPAVVWVTVGLLGIDGFALQVTPLCVILPQLNKLHAHVSIR